MFRHVEGSDVNLSANQPFSFSKAHALALYRSNSVYTFIPKNACSTLRYSLALANGVISSERDINWIHSNNTTFSVSLREAILADYKFVVLRCPFRRLASVYLDKIVGKEAPTAWTLYTQVGRQVSLDDMTFEYFVNSLLKKSAMKKDIHWRPQVDFLLYKEYSDVFCVEEFSIAEKTLKEKINFDVHDARMLTKHGSDQFSTLSEGRWHDVPVKQLYSLKMRGLLPDVKAMYTPELYGVVDKAYKSDIELYCNWCSRDSLLRL